MLNEASIIVNQDGIRNFGSALINAQTYEIFIDEQKVGELNGYHSQQIVPLALGTHSIYVRAYARDSVSVTRTYSCSQRYDVELAPGDNKTFSCGLIPGPPARGHLIFGGVLLALVLWIGPGPLAQLTHRTRSILVTLVAGLTLAGSWYGYSSKPGANIYLKEQVRASAQTAG
jgi:hypothetical protein